MMKWKTATLQTRLYLAAAIILLVGLGIAVRIYLTAGNAPDILGYEAENSKMYRHDLELYGGKANVLAAEFSRWFAGLWQGTSLAWTVACIAMFLSVGILFVAYHLPSALESDSRGKDERGGTDRQPHPK